MDEVNLQFDDEALREVARETLKRNTGARGLRAILEESMIDLMYEVPSDENIESCLITAEAIAKKAKPFIVRTDTPIEEIKSKSKKESS